MNYVIWSIEHQGWWRASRRGYTQTLAEAGVYSDDASFEIVSDANVVTVEEYRIPVSCLEGGLPATRRDTREGRTVG